ncbi:LSU ribosomal protein L24p (L26e) [Candidatus Syntrophocurvum alkaliphilum]|uniref:Large ribosomal subunit protein uL24 n=1 Tax=Candidatus Syntrophocurvum alkaliphilum TaxID=2293317 RepID=A0A6I6DJM1_9FIRM|nr:50S ribosomal protein L24 [Candidatus Syntrophocurvum alkaliphilum]QGU00789.1 LSU ribosomal protein L24p (L26e) [Candidatus Syntrophocurvum alkaliphilum]
MKIKKGDMVMVMTGKDTGKSGKVLRVIPRENRVVIEGVNRVKKHQKPSRQLPQGGIMNVEAPLNASNVMVLCIKCDKPTRIGNKISDQQEKVRYCKQCGEILD